MHINHNRQDSLKPLVNHLCPSCVCRRALAVHVCMSVTFLMGEARLLSGCFHAVDKNDLFTSKAERSLGTDQFIYLDLPGHLLPTRSSHVMHN